MGRDTSTTNGSVVTSLRIERQTLDALRRVADAHRRSVSQEIRWLVDRHLEAHPDAAAPAAGTP